jgi:predicted nuclease of predicted toxin-antitoxin system
MQLYADENFPFPVVEMLRQVGYNVLTAQEDGRMATPDPDVLARAHALGRAVLTHNRRHYERLHRQGAAHSGILTAKQDLNHAVLAARSCRFGRTLSRSLVHSGQSASLVLIC